MSDANAPRPVNVTGDETEESGEYATEFTRAIALSDGIFAFAMTLLVVSVQTPDLSETEARAQLTTDIGRLWPQILSFVIGFLVIGFLWSSHRKLFSRVRLFDDRLYHYNILLLMLVAFLPFPTGVLGRYGNLAFPSIFFALVLSTISILFILVLDHLDVHRELLSRDGTGFDFPSTKARHLVTAGIFLLSIPVALLIPGAGQVVWFLLAINHPITKRLLPHLPGRFRGQRNNPGV